MNLFDTLNLFNEIEEMDSVFKKKYFLINICLNYNPLENNLFDNFKVFIQFCNYYIKYRILFKKKDEKIFSWINSFEEFIKLNNDLYINHLDYLIFLKLYLLIGLIKSDYKIIKNIHNLIIEYLDENLLKSGEFRDSFEHDCLEYHVDNLKNTLDIINDLKKFGYYHYDYLERKTKSGSNLLKSVKFLIPYIQKKKIKFEFLKSIFDFDKQHKNYGLEWNTNDGYLIIEEYKYMNKKIEQFNNILKK